MGSLHIEFFHNNSPGIERYPGTPHVRGEFLFVVCVKRSNCFLTVTPLFLNPASLLCEVPHFGSLRSEKASYHPVRPEVLGDGSNLYFYDDIHHTV